MMFAFIAPIPRTPFRRCSVPLTLRSPLPSQKTPLRSVARMVINVPQDAAPTITTPPALPPLSSAFAEKASGEWFGHEVAFSPRTGEPLNIEERFVPDAFRDWGVDIKGFDTVTSTLVTKTIYQKRTRALPTVGCEADAVVPDIAEGELENAIAFDDGSFFAGPVSLSDRPSWKFAIVDPVDPKSRVRVDFGRVDVGFGKTVVIFERWDTNFCEGQVLPGCGGSEGFAAEQILDTALLDGGWSVTEEARSAQNGWQSQIVESKLDRTITKEQVSVALPRGLSVTIQKEGENMIVSTGWLRGDTRVVLKTLYEDDGALLSVARSLEVRDS